MTFAAAAKSLQSCPTLLDPIDGSPLGSSVPGILQARILEWVAISFSNAWKWKVKVKSLSHAWLLVTPWTAVYQAPPSMGFSRQNYWSGLPLPFPYDLWDIAKVPWERRRGNCLREPRRAYTGGGNIWSGSGKINKSRGWKLSSQKNRLWRWWHMSGQGTLREGCKMVIEHRGHGIAWTGKS